jgi:hypothetical protein
MQPPIRGNCNPAKRRSRRQDADLISETIFVVSKALLLASVIPATNRLGLQCSYSFRKRRKILWTPGLQFSNVGSGCHGRIHFGLSELVRGLFE